MPDLLNPQYQSLRTCKKIGLFDSGVGGLSVLRHLAHLPGLLSEESKELACVGTRARQFLYLGDTARCPYGDRSPTEIATFVSGIVNWLTANGAEAIVVACNTSAAVSLDVARRSTVVPVYDLISPTAQFVADLGRKTGVMATTATAKSRAFSKAIHQRSPGLDVVELSCPDLVPIIESGNGQAAQTEGILQSYVERLLKERVEVLILGCTHFPFLSPVLQRLVDDRMLIVDPAQVLAELVYSQSPAISTSEGGQDGCTVYVTGDLINFARTAELCLKYDIGTIYSVGAEEVVGTGATDSVSSLSQI
jgi:glutamate racemase